MVNIPKLGLLLGSQTKSSTGKGIYAFRGIPYAQPPVGELRFNGRYLKMYVLYTLYTQYYIENICIRE
jgi:carboxylesterase type B